MRCMHLLLLFAAACLTVASVAVTAEDIGITHESHFEAVHPDDYAHAREFVLTDSAEHFAAGHSPTTPPPLTTHPLSSIETAPRNRYAHAMPWADTLHLSFRAHGRTFAFSLKPHHEALHRDVVVEFKHATGADVVTETQHPVVRAYIGVDAQTGDRCHLVMRDDGTAHATMLVDGGASVYQTDHITYHRDEVAHRYSELERAAVDGGEHATMVVFRHRVRHAGDIITGVTHASVQRQLATQRAQEAAAAVSRQQTSDVRDSPMARKLMANRVGPARPARLWRDCYSDEQRGARLTVAIALDMNMVKKCDSKVQECAAIQLHSSNIIYGSQMNVWLTLKHVLALSSTTGSDNPSWNVRGRGRNLASCPVIGESEGDDEKGEIADSSKEAEQQLRSFRSWRMWGKYKHTAGLWHLLSTCRYGGVLGIAWVDSICRVAMGTAITTDGRGISVMWKTFAHEAGHNFGAHHSFENGKGTTGGIMDYGDGMISKTYQFNTRLRKAEICKTVAGTLERTGSWKHKGMMAIGVTSRSCWERGTDGVDTDAEAIETNTPLELTTMDGQPRAENRCLMIRVNGRSIASGVSGKYMLASSAKSPDFAYTYNKVSGQTSYNYSLLKRTQTWQLFDGYNFMRIARPPYAGFEEKGKLWNQRAGDEDDYSTVATVSAVRC